MTHRTPASRLGQHWPRKNHAFSLIELVLVVVIVGILGAIAIPRLSRGSRGAAASALRQDLSVLNKAVDMYAAEHGGVFPEQLLVVKQLTGQTYADAGIVVGAPTDIVYGPYLRQVPPAPLGPRKGQVGLDTSDGPTIGWIYDEAAGTITLNLAGRSPAAELDSQALKVYREYTKPAS